MKYIGRVILALLCALMAVYAASVIDFGAVEFKRVQALAVGGWIAAAAVVLLTGKKEVKS